MTRMKENEITRMNENEIAGMNKIENVRRDMTEMDAEEQELVNGGEDTDDQFGGADSDWDTKKRRRMDFFPG